MKYTYSQLMHLVDDAIAEIPYVRQPDTLYEPMRYVLAMGGKRLRPVLMLLAHNIYNECPLSIMQCAIGIETYHNYTLLHDDLMDNADMRRGKPTVHRRWNANTAILSGDTMLVMAYRFILSVADCHLRPVSELFVETALQIGEGQQMDMDFETRMDVREEEYIEMIRLKTSVLLACALKMGAIMGGADDSDASLLYKFGEQVGLAFQLQDDYLDVYGDPKTFGKNIGGDICCNKKTFMLINALRMANPEQRAQLEAQLEAPAGPEKVEAVTGLYNQIGIPALAQQRIDHYFSQGLALLDAVSAPDDRKEELRAFVHTLMGRQR